MGLLPCKKVRGTREKKYLIWDGGTGQLLEPHDKVPTNRLRTLQLFFIVTGGCKEETGAGVGGAVAEEDGT